MDQYQKFVNLIPPGDTRWNSYFYCFASILNTKEALKVMLFFYIQYIYKLFIIFIYYNLLFKKTLVAKYEPPDNSEASSSQRNRSSELKLPADLCRPINDDNFWRSIRNLKHMLLPLCGCLNILQRDKAYLFEVLHSFGYFYKLFNNYDDDTLSNRMCIRLENRWKSWEQPLLILSFILHPDYRFDKFSTELPNMNWVDIGEWIIYYYCAWTQKEPISILREFGLYQNKQYPFNDATWRQWKGDVIQYWTWCSEKTKELGFIAKKIFGIAVNAASVERLWSAMGFFHSARRNRLHVS
jgi:hypothetical protein